MSQGSIPWLNNFEVGCTISHGLGPQTSPFTDKSLEKYEDKYDKICESEPEQDGRFTFTAETALNSTDQSKNVGFHGGFKGFAWGPISLDPKVSYMKNNSQTLLDVSVTIRAEHEGKIYKNGRYNRLKLDDTAKEYLKTKGYSLFCHRYGRYLVIGEEKGGMIVCNTTYHCNNRQHAKEIEMGLKFGLSCFGFGIGCEFGAKYANKDVFKSIKRSTTYIINPSNKDTKWSKLINNLTSLTKPVTDQSNIKSLEKYKNTFQVQARELLAQHSQTSAAIIVDLAVVKCVGDVLAKQDLKNTDLKGLKSDNIQSLISFFFKFSNDLYFTMRSIQKTIARLPNNIQGYKTCKEWRNFLRKHIQKIETVEDTRFEELAKKYARFQKKGEPYEDQLQVKKFYYLNQGELIRQFENQVLNQLSQKDTYDQYKNNKFITLNNNNNNLLTRVEIRVLEAVQLPNLDIGWNNLSDPYVKVTLQGMGYVFKTSVIDDNLNPKWHNDPRQPFVFEDKRYNFRNLKYIRFDVWDDDGRWNSDDYIGGFNIVDKVNFDAWEALLFHNPKTKQTEGERGWLKVQIKFS